MFKLELQPLGRTRAAQAFQRFFGLPAPEALSDLRNLTPGDFAVVARQVRTAEKVEPGGLVDRLRNELACKPEHGARIGF